MAIGDLLAASAGPQVNPAMGMQAPTQPAGNVEQNKGLWRNFLAQFSDPNFRAAMGATGRGLMQSPQVGQSGWDVASMALGTGVDTLRALREQDRLKKLQEEDRKIKESQRVIENTRSNRQVGVSERNAEIYGRAVDQQGDASLRSDANTDAALAETTRHNKASEAIDAARAAADQTRASFYSTGGKDPADVTKIKLLARDYMANKGMDETTAFAQATRDIELNSKTKDAGGLVQSMYETRVKAYMNSIEGLKTPPTKEMLAQMLNDSINDAIRVKKVADAEKGMVTPPIQQRPGEAVGTIDRTGGGGEQKPATLAKIEAAKARGINPGAIREAIIAAGENPANYGY